MSTRAHIHKPRHLGDRVADAVTTALGSWRFIVAQSVVLAMWIVLNSVGWFYHWDSAPFILLNLCLSFQAAFTGPVVLLSQNRQSAKDRRRDDLESEEVAQMFESHQMLLKINHQQMDILTQQTDILNQQTEMLELLKRPQPKLKPVRTVRSEVGE